MRTPRLLTRRPRPATVITVGFTAAILGAVALVGIVADSVAPAPRPAPSASTIAPGDDNADGRIEEDESGWNCATMGNRQCGPDLAAALPAECRSAGEASALCGTVAARPAYGWTNPDGSRVDLPAGAVMVRDLDEKPGTPEFTAALRALDAEYREHNPQG
ncbi:hypothetical protein ABZV52_30080 [Streptomyces sp. NPDC004735]|uniref:hypothetical protein n=1 Tax=Streptomyces sp. NPDC004735 TaxID=3156654 RepID=UPI0033B4D8C0